MTASDGPRSRTNRERSAAASPRGTMAGSLVCARRQFALGTRGPVNLHLPGRMLRVPRSQPPAKPQRPNPLVEVRPFHVQGPRGS